METSALPPALPAPAPPPPSVRRCRPRLLRLPRRPAIRLGPDVVSGRRERRVLRAINSNADGDRFVACATTTASPAREDGRVGGNEGRIRSAALIDQEVRSATRELADIEDRITAARLELGGLLAAAANAKWMGPVAYAYHWMPAVSGAEAPPSVVYVPGVVQTFVAPTGRLIDVLR